MVNETSSQEKVADHEARRWASFVLQLIVEEGLRSNFVGSSVKERCQQELGAWCRRRHHRSLAIVKFWG